MKKISHSLLLRFTLLFSILLMIYANHFDNSFHFDDSHTIEDNLWIRSLSHWHKFFLDARTFSSLPSNMSYRPLVSLSLAFDYWLGKGYNPFYFHLSTFFWFYVLLLVLYAFTFKLLNEQNLKRNQQRWISFVLVCTFAILTSHAETINYVIARSDLYSALFVLLGMYLFACRSSLPWPRVPWFLLPVAMGMLSKPQTVMFVAIQCVYVFIFEEKIWESSPFISKIWSTLKKNSLSILAVFLMAWFVLHMDADTYVSGAIDPWLYRCTQPYIIMRYIKLYFLPTTLSADTDIIAASSYADPRIYIGLVFLVVFTAIVIFGLRKKSTAPISFGLLWFILTLLPTSWIPLAEVTNDHRMFFPFVGLNFAVVWTVYLLYQQALLRFSQVYVQGFATLLFSGFFSLNAWGAYQRNQVWHDEKSLWYDVTLKSPRNGRGLMNYGVVLMGHGDYQGAESYFLRSLPLNPYYSYLYVNLGVVSHALKKDQVSEGYFNKAIEYGTMNPSAYVFYANWLKGQNRLPEAMKHYERALELASGYSVAREQLFPLYEKLNERTKLQALILQTLQMQPDHKQALEYQRKMGTPD